MVLSGRVIIEMGDVWGNNSVLSSVGAGGIFAEAYACVPGEPLMVNVTAAEDTEVLLLHIGQVLEPCAKVCPRHLRLLRNLLTLSAGHLPRADVRQVLLPDREILIGPQSNCHIPTALLAEPVLLHWQNGQWFCRTKEPVLAGAAAINRQQGLPLGTPLKTGPLSMVITEFH